MKAVGKLWTCKQIWDYYNCCANGEEEKNYLLLFYSLLAIYDWSSGRSSPEAVSDWVTALQFLVYYCI